METLTIDLKKKKSFEIGQQGDHNALCIHFINMKNVGTNKKYIYYTIDGIENCVPLTNDRFIVGYPLTAHSGIASAQLISKLNDNSIIKLSNVFAMHIKESKGYKDSGEYPVDPNIQSSYDLLDDLIDQTQDLINNYNYATLMEKLTQASSEATTSANTAKKCADELKSSTDFINTLDDKVAAQDSKIEKIEASTSHITTKQNTKIAALQTRMSEFTSLKDGSTTGDAELIDARIGADGTKYPSVGDAMRGQAEKINEVLDYNSDNLFLVKTNNYNPPIDNNYYEFKKGKRYVIKVNATDSKNLQIGTLKSIVDTNYIDSTPLFTEANVNATYDFYSKDNANYLRVYSEGDYSKINVTIESYSESLYFDKSEIIETNLLWDKTNINESTTYKFNFIKGKKYKVVCSLFANFIQIGTLETIGENYIDKSPIIRKNAVNYEWEFTATNNANILSIYLEQPTSGESYVNLYEIKNTIKEISFIKNDITKLSNDVNKIKNCVSVYDFNGKKDNIIQSDNWTQKENCISLVATDSPFQIGAVANKYSVAFNRIITYDFIPYENTNVIVYTQSAKLENLWQQGYCVSVDFENKILAIRNKYGNDGTGISNTIPSINKSIDFNDDNYIGNKHRITLERTESRGLKVTLYSLIDLSIISQIEIDFESEVVPSYGLGYDYPAITVSKGQIDLFYLGIKIKNATNCYLYIIGDSLTEGVAVKPDNVWSYNVSNLCGNGIVSGRGGATINSIIPRLEAEATKLKPKYIMVMIGTNEGNTLEKLQNVVNKIKEIGSIPIINCIPCCKNIDYQSINNQILELDTYHVRMDIATSINYDISNGMDESLYLSDGTHLNASGYERMLKRVQIDCPFIFN